MRLRICPEMQREVGKREENIFCAYSDGELCDIVERRENNEVRCGKDLYNHMKNELFTDSHSKRAMIFEEDEVFPTFETGFFSSEAMAKAILDRESEPIGRKVDTSVIKDWGFEPADDKCVFSASESSYACWKSVFVSRLRSLFQKRVDDVLFDVIIERPESRKIILDIFESPVMLVPSKGLLAMKAGQMMHYFAGGEIPKEMLDNASYSEFDIFNTSDRSNCENSWKVMRHGEPIRTTIDAVFPLVDSLENLILELKSSIKMNWPVKYQQRQAAIYEQALEDQTDFTSISFIGYLRTGSSVGPGWSRAIKSPKHRKLRLKEFDMLLDDTVEYTSRIAEGDISVLEQEPTTCGKRGFICYHNRRGACTPQSWEKLVESINTCLDNNILEQYDLNELKFATKIQR